MNEAQVLDTALRRITTDQSSGGIRHDTLLSLRLPPVCSSGPVQRHRLSRVLKHYRYSGVWVEEERERGLVSAYHTFTVRSEAYRLVAFISAVQHSLR